MNDIRCRCRQSDNWCGHSDGRGDSLRGLRLVEREVSKPIVMRQLDPYSLPSAVCEKQEQPQRDPAQNDQDL